MNQFNSNSANYPVYFDGTSSASESGFEESTAPSDNFASIQKNWVIVSPESDKDQDAEKMIHGMPKHVLCRGD